MKKISVKKLIGVSMSVILGIGSLAPMSSVWAAGDYYVDILTKANTDTSMSGSSSILQINEEEISYASNVQLVDDQADATAVAIYQYLKAVGESNAVIYGHMEDTVLKAGTLELSESDTEDLTGSIAGVIGLDCGNLFDGFAAKYNERHSNETQILETTEGNIKAAALLTNEALSEGSIVTLSAHMPNFAFAEEVDSSAEKTYDKYNYFTADSYNLQGDCMNQILPGGAYHEQFVAYLDMVAEYASLVDGAILFRPFHENTGSWFWWGKAFCAAETYKSVYKYTVEYLRDEKNVHNLIYLYGPGSEANSFDEYEERYPGDEYVDMIGFDTYDSNPISDEEGYTFQVNFENTVKLTDEFAKQHDKLFAVTETGISNMQDTGNKRPQWYMEILNIVTKPEYNCCYFMTWSNYSNTNFYTPYVASINEDGTLHGHELANEFISFYNDEKSIFANDQKDVLTSEKPTTPFVEQEHSISGYITSPIAGSRILEEIVITARLNKSNEDVVFAVSNGEQEITLETAVDEKVATAILDTETLTSFGEVGSGKLILFAGDEKLQEIPVILNIEETEEDPLLVDDFESYYGESALLNNAWAVNKDSGCELEISLEEAIFYEESYALKFAYDETKTGWAGATISKEADWSACNALQFLVIPDGKNQKTVIQINTVDGGSYEAYLNNYEDYTSRTEALLVTIPFSEFVDKGERGILTSEDATSITSFGVWLNAILDSDAIDETERVSGVLYYDQIKAVYSDETQASFVPLEDELDSLSVESKIDESIEEIVSEKTVNRTPLILLVGVVCGIVVFVVYKKKKHS